MAKPAAAAAAAAADAMNDIEASRAADATTTGRSSAGDVLDLTEATSEDEDEEHAFDEIIEDENLTELSSYISAWSFWCKFAVWPTLFGLVNAAVFGTLLIFDEYDFRESRLGMPSYYDDSYGNSAKNERNENTYLGMLRYNTTIFAIMLGVDAILLYFAAKYVQKQVDALNDSNDVNASEQCPSDSHWNRQYVYGQVSLKLDAVMGRRRHRNRVVTTTASPPLPNKSILVSVLLLACILCAAFCSVSIADWIFAWTDTARTACASLSIDYVAPTKPPRPANAVNENNQTNSSNYFQGIPLALQSWARGSDQYQYSSSYSTRAAASPEVVQLLDETVYFVTKPLPLPVEAKSSSSSWAPRKETAPYAFDKILAVIPGANASSPGLQFLPEVGNPRSLLVLSSDTNAANASLHAPGFCCVYDAINRTWEREKIRGFSENYYDYYSPSFVVSLLCVDPSDTAPLSSPSQGQVVRNVTLDRHVQARLDDGLTMELQGASLRWHDDCVWIKLSWYTYSGDGSYHVEFYNVSMTRDGGAATSGGGRSIKQQPLQLVSVLNVSQDMNGGFGAVASDDDSNYRMIRGESRRCEHWRNYIQTGSLAGSLFLAALWLGLVQKHVSVASVPICGAFAVVVAGFVSQTLSMALCIVVAATTFVTLLGCGIPLLVTLRMGGSETLVWLLYTSVIAAAQLGTYEPEAFVGWAVGATVAAGSILGHPALYLVGWVGGIGFIVVGCFFSVVHRDGSQLALIAIGVIGGAGCITVGRLMIVYRAYLRYYSTRAWHAVRSAGAAAAAARPARQAESLPSPDGMTPSTPTNNTSSFSDSSSIQTATSGEGLFVTTGLLDTKE